MMEKKVNLLLLVVCTSTMLISYVNCRATPQFVIGAIAGAAELAELGEAAFFTAESVEAVEGAGNSSIS